PWRAGCAYRTSGSEGGPEKRAGRNPGTALRSHPYTRLLTGEGVLWLASVRDAFANRIVGWATDPRATTALVLTALDHVLRSRDVRAGQLIHHSDSEYVRAGVPGLPDPHSDGHARMLVPGCSRAS
ncbi:MAG: hypothetical protein LC700_03135, partial [Actinobacteria bacterium]|nr:hypothetical protein [Actinomycetota bacterium]